MLKDTVMFISFGRWTGREEWYISIPELKDGNILYQQYQIIPVGESPIRRGNNATVIITNGEDNTILLEDGIFEKEIPGQFKFYFDAIWKVDEYDGYSKLQCQVRYLQSDIED